MPPRFRGIAIGVFVAACTRMPRLRALVVLAAALTLVACGEANVEHYEPAPENPPATDFTLRGGVVSVIEEQGCISCHDALSFNSMLDLDVPAAQLRENLLVGGAKEASAYGQDINVEYPEQSLLVLAPLSDSTFAQHPKYFGSIDDPGYQTLLGWVANGALDD